MNRNIVGRPWAVGRAALMLAAACLLNTVTAPDANAARKPSSVNVIPTVTSLSVSNGQLVASGTATAVVRGQTTTVPFTAPVNLSLAEDQTGAGACPILDLEVGPINLNLLGLVVETSPICLQITAYEGGGLLGDLLCSVANLLNAGLPLDQILAGQGALDPVLGVIPGLTPPQITGLLGGVTDLLNAALSNLLNAILTDIIQGTGAVCDILHLELGPLQLNLLGLEVILDDCEGGPVVVDLTGERGAGNLLGNLLCGLLGGGGLGATLGDILGGLLR
jgi:hypothetical protein